MDFDYETELRLQLKRAPRLVHIVNTNDGFVLWLGYPYGERFLRLPRSMDQEILDLCADRHLPADIIGQRAAVTTCSEVGKPNE